MVTPDGDLTWAQEEQLHALMMSHSTGSWGWAVRGSPPEAEACLSQHSHLSHGLWNGKSVLL